MALINCPECGKEISDKAPACPNCGCPLSVSQSSQQQDTENIQTYLDLALKAVQGQNSQQVEMYCQKALEIDPKCSKAWEFEARGILFNSSLRTNNVPQAISAAANAVNYSTDDKIELAISLYRSICGHISGLYAIASRMPTIASACQYVRLVMTYYSSALVDIPELPVDFINNELAAWDKKDKESKSAFSPKKRIFYASHANQPTWADQMRSALRAKGVL